MTTTVLPRHGGVGWLIDVLWSATPHAHPRRATLSDQEIADRLQAVQRRRARLVAEEAELILALADDRPASHDPKPGTPGARGTSFAATDERFSEFLPAELSAIINLGRGTAALRLDRAVTWRDKLPATFAALQAGDLDERRAQTLADELTHATPETAARIEAALLGEASRLSVYRLRDRITALKLALDADAADAAREHAAAAADVQIRPAGAPGRSTLVADLPTEEAIQCHDVVNQLAQLLKGDGDPRPIGALRAHVLSALIRRPADHGLPMVTAQLTVTAALTALEGGTTPGEVNGLPITAAHLQELLARVGALGLTTPGGGSLGYAITGPDGSLLATLTPAELARLARRGCAEHPGQQCHCAIAGAPPATDAYTPTAKQRAFVTSRDRRCRFPNCGQRIGSTDLDHVIEHASGGATDCANLCCLCRSHHRVKTFAPGWRFALSRDGDLTVTTPSGVTRTTRPPGARPRPADPPPGRKPAAAAADEDPPPF